LENAIECFHLNTDEINMEELYEEFCTCIDSPHESNILESSVDVSQKWMNVFTKHGENKLKELQKLISFVLSVPESDAFVKCVFSVMLNKWTDMMNSYSVSLMKRTNLQIWAFPVKNSISWQNSYPELLMAN
jgi:hypothetical protein